MPASSIRHSLAHAFRVIWSLFLNGLFTILPVTLTLAIFIFAFRLLVRWLEPLHDLLALSSSYLPSFIRSIPHGEIVLALISILAVGALMKFFLLHSLVVWIEKYITRIPLVGTIYSGAHKLVNAFSPHTKVTFKEVVIIEFPHKGMYSIGFLAQDTPKEYSPSPLKEYANVFVPTTPNPTTGFFLIVPKDEMIVSSLSRQEAMTLIISGGIIQPREKDSQTVE